MMKLDSDQALASLQADPYWPKWDSPWWHMLLLYEMGETKKIPEKVIREFIRSLNRIPLKIFPIQPHETPPGVDPYRGSPCHCQLGNVYQVLADWGIDVDLELPWIRPWFLRYQMADGGLNCDNEAYLVQGEVPSSMVGTIAAFEAVLLFTPRDWTSEEQRFLQRAAQFLMKRKLRLGSDTAYNADERKSAESWGKLCFPRFYLYDVLRGLRALLVWSEKTKNKIPAECIHDVVTQLKDQFPDGNIKIGRKSFAGVGTILQNEKGEWIRGQSASLFPLLEEVSQVGMVSSYLSQQWADCLVRIENQN